MNDDVFRFFDPDADYGVVEKHLPHWMQSKTICFITWRTWDSMPKEVVQQWYEDRDAWLRQNGLQPQVGGSTLLLNKLSPEKQREFHRTFSARWERSLDDCHGSCPLRQPGSAKVVGDSLLFFDNERYLMTDFVVMPNHLHLLVAFDEAEQMLPQCESWKRFTATKLNKVMGRKGRFWETEAFDHLVRSEEQWRYLRDYIADNPRKANLRDGEYLLYSRKI
jgi:putative transposase